MANAAFPSMTGTVDNTSAATFIPEVWENEIIAAYKSNLVVANSVKKLKMNGKKGDTVHVPKPTRGIAYAKAEGTAVTLQNSTEAEVSIAIDQHYEYSHLIEDITEVQAQASLRKFYTEDAGYALAKQVDSDLLALGAYLGDDNGSGSDWVHSNSFYVNAAAGLAAYAADTVTAGDDFSDLAFRDAIKELDENDTPMDNRFFCLPPTARKDIMGIDRYVSSDFVSSGSVRNGQIGNLYGVDIYITTNLPVTEAASANSASSVDTLGAMFAHKDAVVLVEQQGIRNQVQYKQEWLATMYTADTLYGVKVLRSEAGLVVNLPKS
tara:strand:- start:922 stop:1887 length:966 start_codon:yes stop_codon:yes gene_type:complete